MSTKTPANIKHSCALKGWYYNVELNEYLVNAVVCVDCCYASPYIKHEVTLTSEYVEIWFNSKIGSSTLTIWVRVGLDGYKYAGIEPDSYKHGRFMILLDKVYE